ncbi:P-loop NTPase fold protein [Lactococcus petauri]|uniref:P-loop NTPase fold protein n=1 Tax=Lactococcus petauri TaxID=1940789 RepID=A0ABZ2SFF3_9LACT
MSENKSNFIHYQPIDETRTAEDNFYEILTDKIKVFSTKDYSSENAGQRYKTIFLNGPWGSGKSQFIKNVETNIGKSQRKKFIYLDLWRIKDNRTTLTIAFSKLHCFIYVLSKIIATFAVVLSLTLTPIFGVNIVELFKEIAWVKIIAVCIILLLGVWQFMKYKSDDFYYFLFNCKFLNLKNKILIIDDFDRISKEKQHEAYKFFDIIQGKLPVLFVGDYDKIYESDNDNYLSKIIDRRIELPEVLQSHHVFNNIWNQFNSKFVDEDIDIPYSFFSTDIVDIKQFILDENRSLREIHQFTDIINHEFIIKGKLSTVQPYQQLLIIYVYMFYPNLYRQICQISTSELAEKLSNLKIQNIFSEDEGKEEKKFPITLKEKTEKENLMIDLLYQVLKYDEDTIYPPTFLMQKNDYLINEEVSNLSITEAARIIKDKDELKTLIHAPNSPKALDFKRYLQSAYSKLLEYWKTDDESSYQIKFMQDKKVLEKVVFSEINKSITENSEITKSIIQNPIIDLVVSKLKFAIYYEAQQYFQFYPEINKDIKNIVEKLEERTKMKVPSDKPTIEMYQYMLWNQFLSDFDIQNKKYFFETYYEVVENNQLTYKVSKNNWLFLEENGYICNKLHLEFKKQK